MKININETKIISIYSKTFWNETNIEIQASKEYKLEANGIWKDLFMKCDGDVEIPWWQTTFFRLSLITIFCDA